MEIRILAPGDALWSFDADVTTASTGAALTEVFKEIRRMQTKPVAAEEGGVRTATMFWPGANIAWGARPDPARPRRTAGVRPAAGAAFTALGCTDAAFLPLSKSTCVFSGGGCKAAAGFNKNRLLQTIKQQKSTPSRKSTEYFFYGLPARWLRCVGSWPCKAGCRAKACAIS